MLLGALILLRAYRWLRKDAKNYQREMKALPDAGLVGEMVDLQTGQSQPLPREGIIGTGRDCDIRLKYHGIKRCHALFSFEEGKGVRIIPYHRGRIYVEGIEVGSAAHALHGTQLQIGDAILRVRLFAGLNVPHPAQFAMDMPAEYDFFEEMDEDAPLSPFEIPSVFGVMQNEKENADEEMGYAGGYNEAGEMTWQFAAYPLEELRQAQQAIEAEETEDNDEALPYQSPLPRRRRGDRYEK